MMILQKLKYTIKDDLQLAEKYFSIISILNDMSLAKREIQLLALTSVKGNIGNDRTKEEFVKVYGSSLATVGNIITKLTKKRLLVRDGKTISINEGLKINFKDDVTLAITLEHKKL